MKYGIGRRTVRLERIVRLDIRGRKRKIGKVLPVGISRAAAA
jgi:hypothetical protein